MPLIDARARFYSPVHGRFLQRDPLGAWADTANAGNAYAYVGCDPWNRRDPFGLEGIAPGWLHEGLSWAGFVPGIGVGADLIDGAIYLLDGEWAEAGMAAAAAVPVFGDGFAAGRKVAKAVRVAEELKETKTLRKVGRDVIERLKKVGPHPHDLKDGRGGSLADIYTDREGNLYVGNKDGTGYAEDLWINVRELFE